MKNYFFNPPFLAAFLREYFYIVNFCGIYLQNIFNLTVFREARGVDSTGCQALGKVSTIEEDSQREKILNAMAMLITGVYKHSSMRAHLTK